MNADKLLQELNNIFPILDRTIFKGNHHLTLNDKTQNVMVNIWIPIEDSRYRLHPFELDSDDLKKDPVALVQELKKLIK